jgi:hypothetical protein
VRKSGYDPLAMPPALSAAHTALDKAVDKCYRDAPFPSDRARVEYLFQLYEQLTAPLAPTAKVKRRRKADMPAIISPGKSTPQSDADAAHFYSAMEESTPYRTE